MDDDCARSGVFYVWLIDVAVNCKHGTMQVLFQDVDLVWTHDPVPYFRSIDADISFMDDGARTPRYTPFFVNSGTVTLFKIVFHTMVLWR